MEKKIQAILVDIDDCLLPTDGYPYIGYFQGLQIIAGYVKKANEGRFPKISFCTGRDRNYVEAVAFSVGRPNSWSVIESGIALFNPTTKELVLNPALTPKVKDAFEIIRQERLPGILNRFTGLFDYPGNMINIALERKFGIDTPIEQCYAAVREELQDLESQGLVTIRHSRIAVDISPQGIDKASGIRFLSEKTGVRPSQMLGIGDSKGDFPMLNLVGYVGCPDNASKECKELVRKRQGHPSRAEYAKGVEDVINHFRIHHLIDEG